MLAAVIDPFAHHLRLLRTQAICKAFGNGFSDIHHRIGTKHARAGCHAHPVIACTCRDIGAPFKRGSIRRGRDLVRLTGNHISRAQSLEGSKPHPGPFILDPEVGDRGKCRNIRQRGCFIARAKRAVPFQPGRVDRRVRSLLGKFRATPVRIADEFHSLLFHM